MRGAHQDVKESSGSCIFTVLGNMCFELSCFAAAAYHIIKPLEYDGETKGKVLEKRKSSF